MPWIEIIVSPAGESQVLTKGFAGASCRSGSEFVERALGHASHEQVTAEFYQTLITCETAETEGA
jgi:hypothetical protein